MDKAFTACKFTAKGIDPCAACVNGFSDFPNNIFDEQGAVKSLWAWKNKRAPPFFSNKSIALLACINTFSEHHSMNR